MNALLLYASHDPSALDAGHDLSAERDKLADADDPGKTYLAELLEPGHPLNRIPPNTSSTRKPKTKPPKLTAPSARWPSPERWPSHDV